MELKNRQSSILRYIMDAPESIKIEQLLDDLGIARRTLYYDLEKINLWLVHKKLGLIEARGGHIYAEVKDKRRVEQQLNNGSNYFYSIDERRAMEILYIALSSRAVTINCLMDFFVVSKNTILTDIKEIRDELSRFYLQLNSSIKSGYFIVGEEAAIRKMLWAQLQTMTMPECISQINNFLQDNLVSLTKNEVDYNELCRCMIKQYEIDLGGDCVLQNIQMQSLMIQVSWIRSYKGFVIDMSRDEEAALMNTLSYRSVELSMEKMKRYEIILPQQEIYFITSLFLGIQTTDFKTQEQENLYIYEIAEKLISGFERVACLYFVNRERLLKELSHHIRPLYYRLKYGITVKNPLVKDIFRMYPFVKEFTKRTIVDIGLPQFESISDDELAYLCVYFATNLEEKYFQQSEIETEEVLIIGPENMATAMLVRKQLEDLFGLSLRYTVISANQVKAWLLDDYALIISLIPTNKKYNCNNLIEIGPIFGEEEQRKIIEVLKKNNTISKYNEMIENIIEQVERNVTGVLETNKLYLDLLRYFNERDHQKKETVTSDIFISKVHAGDVIKLQRGTSWETAVLQGSRTLEIDDNHHYLSQRMRNLLVRGRVQMYRMHPDVVLVHCPMQGSINSKIDVSILLSPDGILCGDGKSAKILLFLSTINRYDHWNILKEVYQYFDQQIHVDGIKQMS